jgi:class 3 adenylate cyclase
LATFDGPPRSVRCACVISDGAHAVGLQVRAGLHTGEVELRGDDIAGLGVNIASRIEALARSGKVLVARTVTDLVVGSGLDFDDRGEHDLKGVPGRWQLFAAKHYRPRRRAPSGRAPTAGCQAALLLSRRAEHVGIRRW